MVRIVLEGNISSGKSTLVNILSQIPDLLTVKEPVEEWQHLETPEGPKNFLEAFYTDPVKYGFSFQWCAFSTRVTEWLRHSTYHGNVVFERSIHSDRNLFAEKCYADGTIDALCMGVYIKTWEQLNSTFNLCPDAYIYLRTDPQICNDRMRARSRNEETGVPLEYLQDLHSRHDKWLLHDEKGRTPVLVINGDLDFENDTQRRGEIIAEITEYIGKVSRAKFVGRVNPLLVQ